MANFTALFKDSDSTDKRASKLKKFREAIFSIVSYVDDGFKKVADVQLWHPELSDDTRWLFDNINTDLMYADHRSWVYAIVDSGQIVKLGETAQPLGIKTRGHDQPLAGTKCRFGRLAFMNNDSCFRADTDMEIRSALRQSVADGNVEVWARKCPINTTDSTVCGKTVAVEQTVHKILEKTYLTYFVETADRLPRLNKGVC